MFDELSEKHVLVNVVGTRAGKLVEVLGDPVFAATSRAPCRKARHDLFIVLDLHLQAGLDNDETRRKNGSYLCNLGLKDLVRVGPEEQDTGIAFLEFFRDGLATPAVV